MTQSISTISIKALFCFVLFNLSAAAIAQTSASTPTKAIPDSMEERVKACVMCHAPQDKATADAYYPRIAGKPVGYLYNQLINFKEGRRTYTAMTNLIDPLSDAYLQKIAVYFSQLHPAYVPQPSPSATPEMFARGQILVTKGDPAKNIPACVACHSSTLLGVTPAVPGLLGLPRDYINAQFGAMRNGARRNSAPDCMAQIAQRMSSDDINSAATWLSAQKMNEGDKPTNSLPAPMPLKCGSVEHASSAANSGEVAK